MANRRNTRKTPAKKPKQRVRVVGYQVVPSLLIDDGDSLVPLPVQPIPVGVKEWPDVVKTVEDAVKTLDKQFQGGELSP